ncbi:MAG TPA: hypothetical protein ENN22_02265 [bacterium]|nr:hypothetical protein [bacterium]
MKFLAGQKKWYGFAMVVFGLCITVTCSQKTPEPIIAKAGKTTIPYSEFRDRFEFTPHLRMTQDRRSNKQRVLSSMLGEKLLVEQARKLNYHKDEKYRTYVEEMEKEALVEKLFDVEVDPKIQIDESEVRQAYLRSQFRLNLQVLSFDGEVQAHQAKKHIESGKSMTEVKREFQTDTFISADSVLTIQMEWAQAHPALEDAAYTLKPGEISEPVRVDGRYFILKLINRSGNVFQTEWNYVNQAPSIRNTLKSRKRHEMLNQYIHSLLEKTEVRVSHEIFDLVAAHFEKIANIADTLRPPEPNAENLGAALESSKDLADRLDDNFARFDDGSVWTVGEFIKKLSVGPYRLNYKSREKFRSSLRSTIRRMIEFESLAKKARKLGLHKTYYVQYQTKMWGDSYLGQLMREQLLDTLTISDTEIEHHYWVFSDFYRVPEMIKLHEILVDDEQLAKNILIQIQNNADISALARKYNQRQLSQKSDGVMGYFLSSALGSVGAAARALPIGAIGGPVRTETGQYSVFKVLDKKEAGTAPLQQVWTQVREEALAAKKEQTIDDYLVNLAEDFPIEINNSVLDTMFVNDLTTMLVLKKHYANRMAAPTVTPLDRADRWQSKMDSIFSKSAN